MPQRDVKSRIKRAKEATGIASERSQIRWTSTPAWLPAPRMAMPSPRTVTRERYADKAREFFPDITEEETEQGWTILNGGYQAQAQRAAAPTAPTPDDDLGSIH